jgi:hypothetical protein
MNREKAKILGEEVKVALEQIANKHSLHLAFRGGSFDPMTGFYRPSVEFQEVTESGQPQKHVTAFKTYAGLYNLQADDLGKSFTVRGHKYTIVGLDPKKRTRPVIVEKDGKDYVMSADEVNAFLGRRQHTR